jgi:sulfopyruvate decarboxylase TPP-binding subunit
VARAGINGLGTTAELAGAGVITPLGQMNVAGLLQSQGNQHAPSTGHLLLSNARGTLLLELEAAVPGGAAAPSLLDTFHFTIAGGTGAYQGMEGQGWVSLTMNSNPGPGGTAAQGQFMMSFHANTSSL